MAVPVLGSTTALAVQKADFTILKRRGVWAFRTLSGVIPWLHSASGMLQTTAYLLLGHMAPN